MRPGTSLTTGGGGAATLVVNENDLGAAWFRADTRGDGTLAFETTFGGADSTAAVVLSTPAAADKVQLLTVDHDGTKLADVTALGYSTYRDPDSTGFVAGLPSINLRVDLDGDDVVDTYLVYEPYQDHGNDAVASGQWQTWDAHRDGQARWWGSHLASVDCGQPSPCTWSSIVDEFSTRRSARTPTRRSTPRAPVE